MVHIGPEHALIRGLRSGGSETELTRALAEVFTADRRMAAGFVRLVLSRSPRGGNLDLSSLPAEFATWTEERLGQNRLDLSFRDEAGRWHVMSQKMLRGIKDRAERTAASSDAL